MLLDLESSGGLNVWGSDHVTCGPRGGEVTEESYAAYRARRDECGAQGCGPMQITWPGLQDAADAAGGCWRPEINIRVGLAEFTRLLAGNTVQRAYSRWNTGKPEPSPYAAKALTLLPGWQRVTDG